MKKKNKFTIACICNTCIFQFYTIFFFFLKSLLHTVGWKTEFFVFSFDTYVRTVDLFIFKVGIN
jgi:hypothetical protein